MAKKNVNPKIQHKGGTKPAPTIKDIRAGLGKHKKHEVAAASEHSGWLDSLTGKSWLPYALMGFLLVCVSLLYFPVAFGGYTPPSQDISQWQGAANKIIEYNQKNPDNALWTQSMFSGMPSYMISFPNRWPWLENISKLTDKLINWRIFLLFIGALGMFLLLRGLKLDVWTSFLGAVAFMFSCHWLGLVEIGHNTKFRAIMYIPWVVWALTRLRQKPGLLGLGLLATTLIMQLRENHPQISYYLYLFLGMYWLWQLVESFRSKDRKRFWLFTLLVVVAFGFTVLAVMNPYLSTMEYNHLSQRGGSEGLETSYAQGWSFHYKEIIGFFIPNFYGGVSPDYWGYMQHQQVYHYFGLIVLALGIIALIGTKHRRTAIFLAASSLVFLIMSFGSSTPWLSGLFLKYLPWFNKFRVPSMILAMLQFNAPILAALGVDTILSLDGERRKAWSRGLLKAFWICGGVLLLWLVLAKGIFGGMSLTHPVDMARLQQYNRADELPLLKEQRLDLIYKSGLLSLFLLTLSLGLAWLKSAKKLARVAFTLLLALLVFIDLWVYTGKFLKKENMQARQEYTERFTKQDHDKFMLSNIGNHRIYPVTSNLYARIPETRELTQHPYLTRPDGEWAYHYQTVNGYSAVKLKRYDRMITSQDNPVIPMEWNRYLLGRLELKENPTPVLDMLSVKYVVHPDSVYGGSITQKFKPVFDTYHMNDRQTEHLFVYENTDPLPRAWFVDSVQKVAPADSILPLLRSESFDPRRLAYVETDLKDIQAPDSTRVKQTVAEMHKLAYEVYTDKPAFLVLSEVYYPAGWKATLDGKEIPIHAANYILRGLQIPAGAHKLELVFAPDSYKTSVSLSFIGLLASLLALLGGLAYARFKRPPAPQPESTQADDR